MWKAVLAATAAVIAGSSLVLSQQMPGLPSVAQAFEKGTAMAANPDGTDHFGHDGPRWHPSAEDRSAFTDARIAALKAGLRLTPEQELRLTGLVRHRVGGGSKVPMISSSRTSM